jgi:Flp pilus assembly protein protease CpaA
LLSAGHHHIALDGAVPFGAMSLMSLLDRSQINLLLSNQQYKFYIELAAVAVLSYAAVIDFLTFKIRNSVVLLLFVLYLLFALSTRAWSDIVWNFILAAFVFVVLIPFYSRRAVGGGDVKFITIVCLWLEPHCALLFSALLLLLILLHLIAARIGWARTRPVAGSKAIPYAPSVAGALIGVIMLGCL